MHRFIPSSESAASPAIDPAHTAAIKRWAREFLRLEDESTLTVSEIGCVDAGCPLVETAVTVFAPNETKSWRFTRPRIAVTKAMVQQTLSTPPSRIAAATAKS